MSLALIEQNEKPLLTELENKLRQVITNLMGNAVRFSPDGSPITRQVPHSMQPSTLISTWPVSLSA